MGSALVLFHYRSVSKLNLAMLAQVDSIPYLSFPNNTIQRYAAATIILNAMPGLATLLYLWEGVTTYPQMKRRPHQPPSSC
jgi:hypothetical protein